ncbi:RRP15-like protein [Paramacrobiotus metropolitanus]|uniref:RRP15-like protein n=1 Tax=Paramacrobiotus metropolitanus TaxID=2943436 RepID=UPI002445F860|nr:RRP15-like protein [Paramacrobiotus metropolitanus]
MADLDTSPSSPPPDSPSTPPAETDHPTSGFANAIAKILSHTTTPRPKKRIKREVKVENAVGDAPSASGPRAAATGNRTKGTSHDEPWHVLPDVTQREIERKLNKVATRGVVQLFNAVRQQQTTIAEQLDEAGPSVRRSENVLKSVSKGAFLDLLKDPSSGSVKILSKNMPLSKTSETSGEGKRWEVLDDDYLLKAGATGSDGDNNESRESSTERMEQVF